MFPYPPWVSSSGPRQPGGTQRLDIQKHGHFDTPFGSPRRERQLQSLHLCIATLYSTIPSNSAISCCSPLRMVGVRDVFLQRKMAAATASHGFDDCYVTMYAYYAHHVRRFQSRLRSLLSMVLYRQIADVLGLTLLIILQ